MLEERRWFGVGLLLVVILLLTLPVAAQTTAIRAGHLIDPATGRVAELQTILVKDGKITAVGPGVEVPQAATLIDLSASWVLPGLMDAHVHITWGEPPPPVMELSYVREGSPLRALRGLWNARSVLEAGFTTIRDVGNEANYASIDLRRAFERGWFMGPTLVTTGKIIAPFGGQLSGTPPELGPFWRFEYIDADTPDEMRKAVRQNIYYGAQAIKLVCDNSAYHCSVDEVRAAVAEAHSAGLPVAVHVMGGEAARNVILGGADSIEHGFGLSDELLQMMKEKGVVLVSTDFPYEHLAAMLGEEHAKKDSSALVDRLKRAVRMGVPIAFGTDVFIDLSGRTRGDMMLDYLEVWTSAGMPPAAQLKALTTTASEVIRVQKVRGAIAPGLAADVIATPENPLDRTQALRKVHFVMKDGRVVRGPK
jgi:imidazolonepropionase-like amidohydrolase